MAYSRLPFGAPNKQTKVIEPWEKQKEELNRQITCIICKGTFNELENIAQFKCKSHLSKFNHYHGEWVCCRQFDKDSHCIEMDHCETFPPPPLLIYKELYRELHIPPENVVDEQITGYLIKRSRETV